MNWVNYGTDLRTVEYIRKSYDIAHLIPTMVPVHTQNGIVMEERLKNPNKKHPSPRVTSSKPPTSVVTLTQKPFRLLDPRNNFISPRTYQVYSLQEVTAKFNALPSQYKHSFHTLDDFVKKRFFVSNGSTTTSDRYRFKNGRYDDQRFKTVHFPIIQDMLKHADKPPVGKKPVCFLYGGGSASGKSTVINKIVKPILNNTGLKFAELDCDKLKEQLPEFSVFSQEDRNTAFMRLHRESSDLVNECMDALIKDGRCFTWDGCMGDAGRYQKLITRLKQANYEIHVVGVTVPTEMAIQRASSRDRKVPEDVIRRNHAGFASAFPKVIKMGVDSYSLYDNSQPPGKPNQCIINSNGIQNVELYKKFLQKGVSE